MLVVILQIVTQVIMSAQTKMTQWLMGLPPRFFQKLLDINQTYVELRDVFFNTKKAVTENKEKNRWKNSHSPAL